MFLKCKLKSILFRDLFQHASVVKCLELTDSLFVHSKQVLKLFFIITTEEVKLALDCGVLSPTVA